MGSNLLVIRFEKNIYGFSSYQNTADVPHGCFTFDYNQWDNLTWLDSCENDNCQLIPFTSYNNYGGGEYNEGDACINCMTLHYNYEHIAEHAWDNAYLLEVKGLDWMETEFEPLCDKQEVCKHYHAVVFTDLFPKIVFCKDCFEYMRDLPTKETAETFKELGKTIRELDSYKPLFTKGDKVKVINDITAAGSDARTPTGDYESFNYKGLEGVVTDVDRDIIEVDIIGRSCGFSDDMLELIERKGYTPPKRFFKQEYEDIQGVILPDSEEGVVYI